MASIPKINPAQAALEKVKNIADKKTKNKDQSRYGYKNIRYWILNIGYLRKPESDKKFLLPPNIRYLISNIGLLASEDLNNSMNKKSKPTTKYPPRIFG